MNVDNGEIFDINDDECDSLRSRLQEQAFNQEQLKDLENGKRAHDIESKMVALSEGESRLLKPLSNRLRKNVMRNQPCVCGSGKKFKKCCWTKF